MFLFNVKLTKSTSNTRNAATFFVNGKKHVVSELEPDLTLLDYLRSSQLTGTKLTCGEGGCGACTVDLAVWDNEEGKVLLFLDMHFYLKVVHKPLNSCLVPLYSVDGASITTVEGVGNTRDGLHLVQETLANHFGSQCGFCTPVGLF
jgi:xanthine dehydrogenase/oxidase